MPATAVLIALLAVAPAAADDEPAAEAVPHSAMYVEAGLGAPLGIIGLEWLTRVQPWLELSGGVGIGLAAAQSGTGPSFGQVLQWSLMPRVILGNERGGFTIGAGVSGGGYGDWGSSHLCWDDPCPTSYPLTYALWANAEIGAEAWVPPGLALRIFAGWAHGWCSDPNVCRWAGTDFPYLGGGIGYAF